MNKNSLFKTLLVSAFALLSVMAKAQNFTVEGTIMDSLVKRTLSSATVSIVHAKDSALVSFSRSNDQGHFTIKNIPAGAYLLSISYVGYAPIWVAFKTGKNANINLNNIYLQAH